MKVTPTFTIELNEREAKLLKWFIQYNYSDDYDESTQDEADRDDFCKEIAEFL
tara:strand:+ start:2980 stop:3138 length:159 start_codon:yes stop_codon:yes gene_type:complete